MEDLIKTEWYTNNDFADILIERRVTNDLVWASRKWEPTIAHTQPVKLSINVIKNLVLQSPYLKHALTQIQSTSHIPIHELYKEAEKILEEIGYHRNSSVIRWFGVFISKMLKKLYSAVYVNDTKFLKIKSQMGNNPVIFAPSHKSYCDFILMSYICFHYDVDIPRIAAGMDFSSMAVMGNLLRDACAFFIRRSFNNDKLYSSVFSQYVQTLVVSGDSAIEFFIEGTRSRTAKTLMPKFGFLSMVLKPFFFGLVPDISVIPVNLSYDRILEEILFAYELLGIPKPKESTKGFIKALSFLNEKYGNVYVKFGEPISVREYFGGNIDRSLHGSGPVHFQELLPSEAKQIRKLAYTIVTKQRELITINCFNLIALVLNNNLMKSNKSLDMDELLSEVNWLFTLFKVLICENSTLAINEINKDVLLHHLILHDTLIYISPDGKIQIKKLLSQKSDINSSKLKGHALSSETLHVAIPVLMLQNYVNPCGYFFIGICFIALIVNSLSMDSLLSTGHIFNEFKLLCSIFLFEFVFHDDFIQKDFEKALVNSQLLGLIIINNNIVKRGDNRKLHEFCINFLGSYIPCYLVITEILSESQGEITEKQLLQTCQEILERKLRSEMKIHPANLSLDLVMNAVQALIALKALTKLKGDVVKYTVRDNLIKKIQTKLMSYDVCYISSDNLMGHFSNFIKNNL